MKFSHSIQFNAVPDWSSHYIAYSNLKKLIYELEKDAHQSANAHDPEHSPLIQQNDPEKAFRKALDLQLEKITSFYQLKESETFREAEDMLNQFEEFNLEDRLDTADGDRPESQGVRPRRESILGSIGDSIGNLISRPRRASTYSMSNDTVDDSDEDDDEPTLRKPQPQGRRRKSTVGNGGAPSEDMLASTEFNKSARRTSVSYDDYAEQAFHASSGVSRKSLIKETARLYVQLCELKSFVQLNRTGFKKVLKKFDKIVDRNLKDSYLENVVDKEKPFRPEDMRTLEELISKMEYTYASLKTNGNIGSAKKELRMDLREHVVWERNTVWRDMIGIERKAQTANLGIRRTLLGGVNDFGNVRRQGDNEETFKMRVIQTPLGKLSIPPWLFSQTIFTLIVILTIFSVFLWVPMFGLTVEQQNCLAILVLVGLLWATEPIPLFCSSLLVPFLSVILRVVRSEEKPHHRLTSKKAAGVIIPAMWSPVIMLLLGGFTIASALSKHDIAKRMATFVLSKAGTKPKVILLVIMAVSAFASMFISNVAAPVLMFAIIEPILRNLEKDSEYARALILGIALASNVGGMLSPIASPQNIIAMGIMQPEPGWSVWFLITIPVGIISIILIWCLLFLSFKFDVKRIAPIKPVRDSFSATQWFISVVTVATILLWCVESKLDYIFGEMGVIAIIPIILFYGTGLLTDDDFNTQKWSIIILAAGGLALGKAVNSSGLLHVIANGIASEVSGWGLYWVFVTFAGLILVMASFISHTVTAIIILPLVFTVGTGMEDPRPNLLVMGSAMMCSVAMALATSGFPNMTAISQEHKNSGEKYLRVSHFLTRGIPASIMTMVVVSTVGFGIMSFLTDL